MFDPDQSSGRKAAPDLRGLNDADAGDSFKRGKLIW
jgi:hypothetical protein